MASFKSFVESKFKTQLDAVKYNKYLLMAETLDEGGDAALTWNALDAVRAFDAKHPMYDVNNPNVSDFKEFLSNSYISDVLTRQVLAQKQVDLRKAIANMTAQDGWTKQEVQALGEFAKLLNAQDKQDNTLIYVQYTVPIRYDETASIEGFIEIDD